MQLQFTPPHSGIGLKEDQIMESTYITIPNFNELKTLSKEQLEQIWKISSTLRTDIQTCYRKFEKDLKLEKHLKEQLQLLADAKKAKVKWIGQLYDGDSLKKIDWDDIEDKIKSGNPNERASGYSLYYDKVLEVWKLCYDYGTGGGLLYLLGSKTQKTLLRVKEKYLEELKKKEEINEN